jgi:hypothetical protein
MSFLVAEAGTSFPLTLVVNRAGVGGVTGLVPTVALRRGDLPAQYLDWSDLTFKTSGWTTKYGTLAEVERGHYQRMLSLSAIGAAVDSSYVAQFSVNNGGDVRGEAEDVILVVPRVSTDVTLLRKALTNRMEETPGNPGQLTLFDDDGFTVLARWELRDVTGNSIISTVGTPARRSALLP